MAIDVSFLSLTPNAHLLLKYCYCSWPEWKCNQNLDKILTGKHSGLETSCRNISGARVFTFEYNASAAFGNTTADIADHARTLLSSLVDHRENYNEHRRPLLFVAHSLGGILVKQAC
jgi:hypothetical protein